VTIRISQDDAAVQPRLRGIGLFPGFPTLEAAFIVTELIVLLTAGFLFFHFSRQLALYTDGRLSQPGANGGPALILSAPAQLTIGQEDTPGTLAPRLRNALYVEGDGGSTVGTFKVGADSMEIHPGPASYFNHGPVHEGAAVIKFHAGHIASITSLDENSPLQSYLLEPEIITTLSGFARSEHLVRFQDIPPVLLNAVIATEDHRFFSHHGVNLVRLLRAARIDIKSDGKVQGGSTLTMQLARNLFLTPRRTFSRKLQEIGLALFLETRLSKKQIFELYANRVYIGQQGNFGIFGFGDAAQAYFNKDISKLDLPEAALLAGVICAPNSYSPYKYPQRALERRNHVLRQMVATGYITRAQAESAMAEPINPAKPAVQEGRQQGYFEDMVVEQLRNQFSERQINFGGLKVYTTLDLDLERNASDAARVGADDIDQALKKAKLAKTRKEPGQPQIALVALDPQTGEVKALIGGRDYGESQLNHVLARRQPGSVFKPFVYAAALNSGVDGSQPLITPATLLNDEPTQFQFGSATYAPRNYKEAYHGTVTVRQALMDSMNIPTVSLAEMIGFDKVRALALAAGFNTDLQATPSLALGSYVSTPLEVSGAYTVFANDGDYVAPHLIVEVDDAAGNSVWSAPQKSNHVLDPRVNYLMVSLLQSVIDGGTGWGVRNRGFRLPVAGKTGTSHDGWFAGFTSSLVTVAWVGYDDDHELNLAGADSALPLWTEFMKRAVQLPAYKKAVQFKPPSGIVSSPVATQTSTPDAPEELTVSVRNEYFIRGTEPQMQPAAAGEPETVAVMQDAPVVPNSVVQPENESSTNAQALQPNQVGVNQNPGVTPSAPVDQAANGSQPNPASNPAFSADNSDAQTGELRIQTDPPALQVMIDGNVVGASPVNLTEPVGDHTYRIIPPNGKVGLERSIQIKPAEIETINVHY
jgi:penicillin-binding protein 1B